MVCEQRGGEKWTSRVGYAVEPQPQGKKCCLGYFLARMSSTGVGVQSTGGGRFTVLGLGADNQSALACWTESWSLSRKE